MREPGPKSNVPFSPSENYSTCRQRRDKVRPLEESRDYALSNGIIG